jgi:glycosyltransferase family 2
MIHREVKVVPKISIIVPVYGVEKYLPYCLDSIIGQSFTDYEVILVDDCSKDNSGKICDAYSKKDSRFRVIHKKQNEGLGYARRDGLAAATGEWSLFVDSDDWLASETLSILSEKTAGNMDILVFGITLYYENIEGKAIREERIVPLAAKASTKQEIGNIMVALDTQRCYPYMCNKLYRTRFLKECGVAFNTIQSMEDFFYNIEVFKKARGIAVIPQPLYRYRKPARETLVSAYNPHFFELCKKRNEAEKAYIREMDVWTEENLQKLDRIHLNHLISCMIKNTAKNSPLSPKEQRRQARQILQDPHTRAMLRHIRCGGIQYAIVLLAFRCRAAFAAVWLGRLANYLSARSIRG